jgi:hypothetical protein
MADKPTFRQSIDDLVSCLRTLPYATHIRIWPEGQITIDCKEGTLVLRASIQRSHLV